MHFNLIVSSLLASVALADRSACDASAIRVDTTTGLLVDACGRQRIFRGINSVRKGAPWINDPSKYLPNGQSLSDADALLFRSLGMNLVRLGIMWSGVSAVEGSPDAALLSEYAETSARLATVGIRSLLDAHQDGFSPAFCDDGAPPWVARECAAGAPGFPEPLDTPFPVDNSTFTPTICSSPKVPAASWFEFYFTNAVGQCFGALYNTTTPTNAAFRDFWVSVVKAYAAASDGGLSILAYELLNEPWAGDALANPALLVPGVADSVELQPFYGSLTKAIRQAEAAAGMASKIVSMEPVTWDDIFPVGFSNASDAWPLSGLELLSYHFYALPDFQGSALQVSMRAADALRLGAAAILTEFDAGLVNPVNAPYGKLDMRATLNACEKARHGSIGWDYSCLQQGGDGTTLHTETVRELARPVPLALAGSGASEWRFDASDETAPRFNVTYVHERAVSDRGGPSSIFLSTGLWFDAATLEVNVTSTPPNAVTWTLDHSPGRVSLPAANETQIPAPDPLDYTLLTIVSAAGAPDTAVVTVSVSSGGRR